MTIVPRTESRSTDNKVRRIVARFFIIGIVLLSFGLRLHDLEGQSMWSDEGLSLYRSGLSVSEIFSNVITVDGVDTQDTNPPFYFLLLHLMRSIAGETIFALRFTGVVVAILAIPLIYLLGQISLGNRVGLLAAILLAISPFHIWQSQVLRHYGVLISINLLSVYGLWRYLFARAGSGRIQWLLLWLGAGLLGVYTHYYGFLIFAYELIAIGIHLIRRWRISELIRKWPIWIALGLLSLILLPAILISYDRFSAGQQIDFYRVPFLEVLNHAASAYSVGVNWSLTHPSWRVLPVIVVALFGLWFGWRQRLKSVLLIVGFQVIPLALLLLVSFINPLYNGVRHLLIGLPPFLLLVASGIVGPLQQNTKERTWKRLAGSWKFVGPSLALFVFVNQGSWLYQQFTSPNLIRDDIRGAAYYLNEHAGPGDIIVLHDSLIRFTVDYYYDGDAPLVALPKYDQYDKESTIDGLRETVQGKERIWFLSKPTPRNSFNPQAIPEWLQNNLLHLAKITYPAMWLRVQLDAYAHPATAQEVPGSATTVNVSWDRILTLEGFEIPQSVKSGDMLFVNFYFSQPADEPVQHTLSLWLVDSQGNAWPPIRQTIPQGYPPAWNVAETVTRYQHRVRLPAGYPPGRYALWMRLVNTADGQVVPTIAGEKDYFLADINLRSASCSDSHEGLHLDSIKPKKFGNEIELTGYSVITDEIRPGHEITVDLLWCARQQPQANYRGRLLLASEFGQIVAQTDGPLSTRDYPPEKWQTDELLLGHASLVAPASLAAGTYYLDLLLLPPDSEDALTIGWPLGKSQLRLGSVEVKAWPMITELPPITAPIQADFGQPPIIELQGFDLTKAGLATGEQIDLTLIWRSRSDDIPLSYTVFVHLTPEGSDVPIAQGDAKPVGGFRPTTSWRIGEVIEDSHEFVIPSGTHGGKYNLWIGFYDDQSGKRLPITGEGLLIEDNRLWLQDIEIRD